MPEAVRPRWLWQNFILLSNTLTFVSSQELNFPKSWLRDPLRSKRWRSKTGWTIITGFNDKLDFTEGITGDAVATLTEGTYETGALMATEIQTQLNASATDNVWTCTYSAITNLFTIGHDNTETGGLEWFTGANSAAGTNTSVGLDLGFDVSADDTGASSYPADNVSYQSRHWIYFDLVTSFGVRSSILFDTNLTASNSVTLQGNASATFTAPTFEQVLTFASSPNNLFAEMFVEQSFRYWRFLIDAVDNEDGFIEIGVPFICSYTQPSQGYGVAYSEGRDELSDVQEGDQGAQFQNVRPTRRQWNIQWNGMTNQDKLNLEAIVAFVKLGRPFFFALDTRVVNTNIVYVYFDSDITFNSVPVEQWAANFQLVEALG